MVSISWVSPTLSLSGWLQNTAYKTMAVIFPKDVDISKITKSTEQTALEVIIWVGQHSTNL